MEPNRLVARRDELETIERFCAGASTGEGATALAISGPAGIGKTTVWRAGVERARSQGWRVLVAEAANREAALSFAGLADLLATVDDALLESPPPPQRRALAAALLRADDAGSSDFRALAAATTTVLGELAASQPTLIAVDDAQWLDAATADALRFALRRLGGAPVAALVSVRQGGGRPETFETALPRERRSELKLAPLTLAAVHEVIRARLGVALPRRALVRIVERTEGNVFFALEIARELLRSGDVARAADLPLPPSVQELVGLQVARLPPASRDALLLASALAVPTTAAVPVEDLAAAEDAGIVRVDAGGRIHFEHPLLASAIYESTPVARRRDAHRRLANRSEDLEERARHLALAAAGPDEVVAAELDAAVRHTAARGASTAAAQLAQLALAATPGHDADARARRTVTLAHQLLVAGETAGARAALEQECARYSEPGDLRARLLRELGSILWYEGERETGYGLLREALENARDPELAARTHAAAAWLLHDTDLPRAIEHADAAVGLFDPGQQPGPYSSALLLAAYLRLTNGEPPDEEAYMRGRALQEQGVEWDDVSPVVGMWPLLHDDFADARAIYRAGLERSRAAGDVTNVQGTLVRLAEIECWTGDWPEADRLAAEAVALADRTDSTAYLGSCLYARALVDAHLGRLESAQQAGERILATFEASVQAALGEWVLGFVALSRADAAGADAHYTRAQEIVDALGQREPARFRFQPDQVEAVVALGDLPRARALLDALDARGAVFPRPWLLATAARGRALLAAAGGDLAAAQAAGEEALRHHAELAMPFERARTLVVQGGILRRLKQKRAARTLLEEAVAIFERLGAPVWSATARAELARTATRRAAVGLTPTERRIAELAAAGFANPEIAARVFVSRKTVEANLARAYRKLGIASRAQLARALDRDASIS